MNDRDGLKALLTLVEAAGQTMSDNAALVAEHGGSLEQLREIVAQTGRIGLAMLGAVERTREKHGL